MHSLLIGLLVPLGVVALVARPFGAVTRNRLERFARRQALVITPVNGSRVIGYLRTTRRWRGSGILIALGCDLVRTAMGSNGFRVGLEVFAGWFVGAVIAEWRVGSGSRDGVRRAASLLPRRASDYVPTALWMATVGAFVAVAAFAVGILISANGGRLTVLVWLLGLIATGSIVALVARHVLHRPQALDGGDVLAADDALRSRSLHALLGSGLALAGYALAQLSSVAAEYRAWGGEQWPSLVTAIGIIVLPMVGITEATATFVPRSRRRSARAVT